MPEEAHCEGVCVFSLGTGMKDDLVLKNQIVWALAMRPLFEGIWGKKQELFSVKPQVVFALTTHGTVWFLNQKQNGRLSPREIPQS